MIKKFVFFFVFGGKCDAVKHDFFSVYAKLYDDTAEKIRFASALLLYKRTLKKGKKEKKKKPWTYRLIRSG